MPVSKKSGKKNRPQPKNHFNFDRKVIQISVDDLEAFAAEAYRRLPPFRSGTATFSDRTGFLLRIQTGIEMLKYFDSTGVDKILKEGLELIKNCRDQKKKCIRKFTEGEYVILTTCISLVHRMTRSLSVWECATSQKAAEDIWLPGSSEYEYIFQKEVK